MRHLIDPTDLTTAEVDIIIKPKGYKQQTHIV